MRISDWSSDVCSSDLFAPEFDLLKRWSGLLVRTRFGGSLTAYYSTDGGTNFTVLTDTETQTGEFYDHDIDLTGIAASKQIRFKFELTRTTEIGRPSCREGVV